MSPELPSWEEFAGVDDPEQRYRLYALCECSLCRGTGKSHKKAEFGQRCKECRGEGKMRNLVATCNEENLGYTIITLGREGTWSGCPMGLLDVMGEINQKWLVLPWGASPRQVSDAARVLARSRKR